jgi:hypothetical protein
MYLSVGDQPIDTELARYVIKCITSSLTIQYREGCLASAPLYRGFAGLPISLLTRYYKTPTLRYHGCLGEKLVTCDSDGMKQQGSQTQRCVHRVRRRYVVEFGNHMTLLGSTRRRDRIRIQRVE